MHTFKATKHWLHQSVVYVYWKNNPDKFHPDPIWNDGAFEEHRPNKNRKKNKMSCDIGSVPDLRIVIVV